MYYLAVGHPRAVDAMRVDAELTRELRNQSAREPDVIAGGPAARAGLEAGMQVAKTGRVDPASLPPEQRIHLVLTATAGKVTRIRAIRAGGEIVTRTLTSVDLFPPAT